MLFFRRQTVNPCLFLSSARKLKVGLCTALMTILGIGKLHLKAGCVGWGGTGKACDGFDQKNDPISALEL